MRTEWDINSNDNTLFVTAQCNNRCIMCCQPPLSYDDVDALYEKSIQIIDGAPEGIKVVGITGGEPTLLGNRLFSLIEHIRRKMPSASIHILSNGRNFSDLEYTRKLKEVGGDKVFVGIPIHSDYYKDHDLIAGVNGAFEETMLGLYNLNSVGIDIELRIVINAINYRRLTNLSNYIFKNLPFVSWVAFMGMEHTGYAISNEKTIWIEPIEYKSKLTSAIKTLAGWNIDVSVYNIPHCLLDSTIWDYAQKSISDWKIKYTSACEKCTMKDKCCGLFSTSKSIYKGIKQLS